MCYFMVFVGFLWVVFIILSLFGPVKPWGAIHHIKLISILQDKNLLITLPQFT